MPGGCLSDILRNHTTADVMVEFLVFLERVHSLSAVLLPVEQVSVEGPDVLHATLSGDEGQSNRNNLVVTCLNCNPTPTEIISMGFGF